MRIAMLYIKALLKRALKRRMMDASVVCIPVKKRLHKKANNEEALLGNVK